MTQVTHNRHKVHKGRHGTRYNNYIYMGRNGHLRQGVDSRLVNKSICRQLKIIPEISTCQYVDLSTIMTQGVVN